MGALGDAAAGEGEETPPGVLGCWNCLPMYAHAKETLKGPPLPSGERQPSRHTTWGPSASLHACSSSSSSKSSNSNSYSNTSRSSGSSSKRTATCADATAAATSATAAATLLSGSVCLLSGHQRCPYTGCMQALVHACTQEWPLKPKHRCAAAAAAAAAAAYYLSLPQGLFS